MRAWVAAATLGLAALAMSGRAPAQSLDEVVPEGRLTIELIKHHLDQAAYKTEIDDDGDLKVTDDRGFIAFFRLDAERKLITLFAVYPFKRSAPELARLRFVNQLNDKVIIVRFSMPEPGTLWCDYQFTYENGLTPRYILRCYRLFALVAPAAVGTHDQQDLIGRE